MPPAIVRGPRVVGHRPAVRAFQHALLAQAAAGTLFIQELEDLPPAAQRLLVGALEVPGGTLGTTVKLVRPAFSRTGSCLPGPDGFMRFDFNPTSREAWQRVQAANLKSVFLCCTHALPHLTEVGAASLLNATSLVALIAAAAARGPRGVVPGGPGATAAPHSPAPPDAARGGGTIPARQIAPILPP